MREKSRFITFVLSIIPGLSHFYLGFVGRATTFLIVFIGALIGVIGMSVIAGSEDYLVLLIPILPLIWLVALVDAFSLRKETGSIHQLDKEGSTGYPALSEMQKSNEKTITMALSTIPGAGHMYMGYMEKGLIIMSAFLFSIFFMGWLGLSLLLFLLPLIWFYSFFDALHSFHGGKIKNQEIPYLLSKLKPKWIGWTLISIGILIIAERIVYPLIPHMLRDYIQTSIVALAFIYGGTKLLKNHNNKKYQEEGEDICDKNE